MGGYVYLVVEWNNITVDNNPVKIGVTTGSIENRIKKLQTGNNSELHVITYYKTDYPFKLEKMLHLHYAQFRNNGEWFNLTDEQIIAFKKICQEKEDIIKMLLRDNCFYN